MRLLLAVVTAAVTLLQVHSAPNNIGNKKVVCYFGSWAQYRWGPAKFDDSNVQCGLCTHFIYTFVGLDDNNADVKWLDAYGDIGDGDWKKEGLFQIIQRKCKSENTMFMMAIGGWNEGSEKYSRVVGNPATRTLLINNIYKFVKINNLDGFDLDWEYPAQRGGAPSDKLAYTELIKGLHEKFSPEGLLLSAAVNANIKTIDISYDLVAMNQYLDFINLMAYDLHGSWDSVTGHNAPLYAGSQDGPQDQHLNILATAQGWLSKGALPEKLILGLAAYGRSFTLTDSRNYGMGAPAGGTPPCGWVPEAGFYGFNEICADNGTKWTTYWDDKQKVPYAVSGNKWVGYDDVASFREKACLAKKLNLGGLMLWTIETDDFRGTCGLGQFPLIHTMIDSLADPTCGGPITDGPITSSTTTAPVPSTTSTTSAPSTSTQPSPASSTSTAIPPPSNNPSTTTTQSSYQPESINDNSNSIGSDTNSPPICTSPGQMMQDRTDPAKFYMCANGAGGMTPMEFRCPKALVFDSTIKGCNYPRGP